ncbi:unnamed protein product [Zymoseptoria tritici ST99CH_3D7]|uniref:Uncharacterized protein n=1 Tax=Zymoseptoria tritici (strain ST99CH_3D7) TaxID=1276538 RepID=A0A1X7S301_ZYMT9|nr:unnamed protein product [Zymoseptoria tritici ST99CH_3D7]
MPADIRNWSLGGPPYESDNTSTRRHDGQHGTDGLAETSKYRNYDDEDVNEDFKYQYFNYQYFDYEDVNPRLVSHKSVNHCYNSHYEADNDSIDHSPHDS